MEGTRIGAYQVESELGSGAMGTVHLAQVVEEVPGLEDGQRVAIKLLHPHLLAQPGFFKRFMREAEVGRQVEHENVVRTFDVDALEVEGKTAHFLVMEYVEGRTLRAMLHDLGTVPEALLREIARQVAAGLSAIHDVGVVHRDLKPENILVTDDHQVRIMDLGVARLVEESVALTRKGEFAGSLLYAAPEQFRDEEVGPLSDLYSLGVLLYELATGANPFRRDAAAQVISAHLEDKPRTATEVGAELSPFFGEVLTTLLAKTPERRFDSAEALREVLEQGERSTWWAERERELLETRGHLPKVPVRRETVLYGRETELEVLREAWNRARQGQGNTILLEGEAGIGKTRLVDTLLKDLEGDEVHVLYGSYPPSGGMGGLSDAITDHFGLRGLEEALRPYLTVTPSLVPAFAALVKHESPPTGSEPIQGDALHAVMVHLMRGHAMEKPLVWVIDDLHFSEPDSRKIVLSLARAVEGHRVLLLTTTRPGLPEDELAHFSRLENFRRVSLERLFPRDVIQLLRDAFKSEMLAEKLGGKIAYKSDGVPFFVFEMIRGLREGQLIREMPDGTWVETQVIEEIEVPSAVKDLIEARLRGLSDEDRYLLDVAAVCGFEFSPDLIARVLERKRVAVLQRLAVIERRSGVVRAAGRTFRFDHHQIQEILHQNLAESLREEYHTLLAEAHEARLEGEPAGEDAVFLTSHHVDGCQPRSALPHLVPALEHLEGAYRNEAAIELADRALASPGLLDAGERIEVLLRKAGRLDLLGRRREERAALDEARTITDRPGDPLARARVEALLGRHLWAVARYEEAESHLLEALTLARRAGDEKEEASIERGIGNVLLRTSRFQQAREHYERSLALSRDMDDVDAQAAAAINVGVVSCSLGQYEDARRDFEEGLELARKAGNKRWEANAWSGLGNVSWGLGNFDVAREQIQRKLDLARETGDRQGETTAIGNLGGMAHELGRHAEALEVLGRFLAFAREIGSRWGESNALGNLGTLLVSLGDRHGGRERLEAARTICVEMGDRHAESLVVQELATLTEQEGNRDEAIGLCEEALALRRGMSIKPGVAASLASLGGYLFAAGRPEEARPHLEEARSLGQEITAPGPTVQASCLLAMYPSGDVERAVSTLVRYGSRLDHTAKMRAYFLIWRATHESTHLMEAHRLLCDLVDHAPEEYRESMIENVPLHRDIMAAWKEQGGE